MSSIRLEGVTKRFGQVIAVDAIDLEVTDGEFMVLLGPSGCGKTTVLRLIAGLDSLSEGSLRIGDRVVNDVEAKDRDVSLVFQSYALYPHMSVFRNIESPLVARRIRLDGDAPRHLSRAERADRVREVAATLGLAELLDRKPAALSGGQRQRVALARAIVSRPAAFLMDEPLSNLDAKLRVQTRLELAELHQRLATTVVYVTHDQVEAMTLATRLAILDQGRLQQLGTPREVYERPCNLFVAQFIGNPPMNIVPGSFGADAGAPHLEIAGTRLPWPDDLPGPAFGSSVVVGVRPEHLVPGADGIPAEVRAVEWLGSERHLVTQVGGATVVVREGVGGHEAVPGEVVRLTCEPRHVHLFDPVTTERLG
jgi:multiple sugar transport system ATP-binding protein